MNDSSLSFAAGSRILSLETPTGNAQVELNAATCQILAAALRYSVGTSETKELRLVGLASYLPVSDARKAEPKRKTVKLNTGRNRIVRLGR